MREGSSMRSEAILALHAWNGINKNAPGRTWGTVIPERCCCLIAFVTCDESASQCQLTLTLTISLCQA